ncbi:MAG: alpha/beta hydrolase [Thermodesulfobacteriota bacterium]|nr:alpha/beta hydrolase [Thermodesulfobacteriota bacterium]
MMIKERTSILVDGIRIVGEVYLPDRSSEKIYPAVCLCHGVPARVKDPTDRGYQLLAENFCEEGFAVLIFNFRGAGESEGNFDILGWTRDLNAMLDFFSNFPGVDKSRISLMGFSGGAAVCVYVTAHESKISSLVTCACPSEFSLIAQPERVNLFIEQARTVGIIRDTDYPPSLEEWLNGFEEVSPIRWIDRISPRPMLIIHGTNDDTIDVSHAWRLYEKANEPKEISIIEGAEHKIRTDKRPIHTAIKWLKKINAYAS